MWYETLAGGALIARSASLDVMISKATALSLRSPDASVLVVSVGNTSYIVATLVDGSLVPTRG